MQISRSFLYQLPVAIGLLLLSTFVLVALSAPGPDTQQLAALQRAADSIAEIGAE